MDRWVYVKDDGTIIMHIENDGAAFLRRGAEAVEWVVTLDELKKSYPRQVKDAEEQLAKLKTRMDSHEHQTNSTP